MTALHLTFVLTHFNCTKEQKYCLRSSGGLRGLGNLLLCDYHTMTNTEQCVLFLSTFRVGVYQQNKLRSWIRVRDTAMLIFFFHKVLAAPQLQFTSPAQKKERRQGREKDKGEWERFSVLLPWGGWGI